MKRIIEILIWSLLSVGILGMNASAFAQSPGGIPATPRNGTIHNIQIGPHPDYTRILLNLDQAIPYQIRADFKNRKIRVIVENVDIGPQVKNRIFKDVNLEKIEIRKGEEPTEIWLYLRNPNSRFIHFLNNRPPQIVLDVKGHDKPFLERVAEPGPEEKPAPSTEKPAPPPEEQEKKPLAKPAKAEVKIPGMTEKKLRSIRRKDINDKEKNGWDDYQRILKEFQSKDYPKALESFKQFREDFPESEHLGEIAYLNAEAEFRLVFKDDNPIYEKALKEFKTAARNYPESRFRDHALMKMAFIYDELGYRLEAQTLYSEGIRANPKSPYTQARRTALAFLMLDQGRLDEAYRSFQDIIKKSPENDEAKDGIFEIANKLFDQKNIQRAQKIFEDASKRWPNRLSENPQVHFRMGEIYYGQGKYKRARKHYFALINMDPDSETGHRALNRIGDSYLIEENYRNSMSVFDESSRKNPGSRESQYATVRMADLGIRNPSLPLRDLVFDVSAYYEPLKTYDRIEKEAADVDILSEVILSRGIALLKEQRYLESLQQLKKLLPLGPESRFYSEAAKYIRQALVFLVDRYSSQTGVLPILYSYTDFTSLSLGEIKNVKTLVQIGEAYQSIAMYQEAINFYEKAKRLDGRGLYTDRILLDLGKIHLENGDAKQAELVARTFLNRYPENDLRPDALDLLASSYHQQGKRKRALATYDQLLKTGKGDPSLIHYQRAGIYEETGKKKQAIDAYKKSIDTYDRGLLMVPKHVPRAYHKLGLLHYKGREYKKARTVLQAAVDLFPRHRLKEWNAFLLADIQQKLKDKDAAQSSFESLVKSDSTEQLLKRAAESKLKLLSWEKEYKDFL